MYHHLTHANPDQGAEAHWVPLVPGNLVISWQARRRIEKVLDIGEEPIGQLDAVAFRNVGDCPSVYRPQLVKVLGEASAATGPIAEPSHDDHEVCGSLPYSPVRPRNPDAGVRDRADQIRGSPSRICKLASRLMVPLSGGFGRLSLHLARDPLAGHDSPAAKTGCPRARAGSGPPRVPGRNACRGW